MVSGAPGLQQGPNTAALIAARLLLKAVWQPDFKLILMFIASKNINFL
jgi:hypothetical protein